MEKISEKKCTNRHCMLNIFIAILSIAAFVIFDCLWKKDIADNFLKHYPINVEFWSNVVGSLIGAIVTFIGIKWTLDFEYRKSKEDLVNNNRPFLQYFISIGVYPYRVKEQSKRTAILDYVFQNNQKTEAKAVIFPLHVNNIGLGAAFIKKVEVKINGTLLECGTKGRDKIINKDKDSVFYIKINNVRKDQLKNLNVLIIYKDFFDTEYTDVIKIAYDAKPQLFDKDMANEALIRYFESFPNVNQPEYKKIIKKEIIDGNFIVKELAFEATSRVIK